MSISEGKKIDIVAVRPGSAIVRLVITDDLDWSDLDGHSRLLQNKVNTYLEFVSSGQLGRMETPKLPESPEIEIALVLRHAPPMAAVDFLKQVDEFVAGLGMKFRVEIHEPERD